LTLDFGMAMTRAGKQSSLVEEKVNTSILSTSRGTWMRILMIIFLLGWITPCQAAGTNGSKQMDLTVIAINVCSILSMVKRCEFKGWVRKSKADIILCSETKIKQSQEKGVKVPGYNIVFNSPRSQPYSPYTLF